MPFIKTSCSITSYAFFQNPALAPDPIIYGSYSNLRWVLAIHEEILIDLGTDRIANALFEVYHLTPGECYSAYGQYSDKLSEEILRLALDNFTKRKSCSDCVDLKLESGDADGEFRKILQYLEKNYPITSEFFEFVKEKMQLSKKLEHEGGSTFCCGTF